MVRGAWGHMCVGIGIWFSVIRDSELSLCNVFSKRVCLGVSGVLMCVFNSRCSVCHPISIA